MFQAPNESWLALLKATDYVLVTSDRLFEAERLLLRCIDHRCIVKTLNNYVFRVRELRNESLADVHGGWLKCYRIAELDERATMLHMLSSGR